MSSTRSLGNTATIAHGYTIADVEKAAAWACRRRTTLYLDPQEKWDTAWFGILEMLYESEERPEPKHLQFSAEHAISEASRKVRSDRGHSQNRSEPGPNFNKYWRFMEDPVDGFTDRLVERMAIPQILAILSDAEYEAIAAQAIYLDAILAAQALRLTKSAYHSRLKRARTKLIAAWFEHETPRKKNWGDAEFCRWGHPRALYGITDTKSGLMQCRKCKINVTRAQYQKRKGRVLLELEPESETLAETD